MPEKSGGVGTESDQRGKLGDERDAFISQSIRLYKKSLQKGTI